jgi:AbrB family looped-hinge helix DNA binding protein
MRPHASGDSITKYYKEVDMETTSVTSKGQVTIPKEVRQQLGIRQGSRIEFAVVGSHVEMRVKSSPTGVPDSGFGMLKSRRVAVPVDFDPATLLT